MTRTNSVVSGFILERTAAGSSGSMLEMNSALKTFGKVLSAKTYFTNPHSPWEKGLIENTNLLIRQYFPKGTDFNLISDDELKSVQDELNNRPRKSLGWQTPKEVFFKHLKCCT
ncbi:MAG: IS30 family transposase [Spirochaetia bacterium]|nr:IS30 family transposase [Spirochaetia bacterium]